MIRELQIPMRQWVRIGVAIISLFTALQAHAFGLKTHAWIAEDVLREITSDCTVTIQDKAYPIEPERCSAIRRAPGAFLSGALGPDVYPDFVVGQVTTHPGVEHGWQTGEWLDYLMQSADSDEALAFASGYALHAAMDMWAHSYVNSFAGDIFAITDERAVEARHVALEKYLDSALPSPGPRPASLQAPAAFLSQRLIFDDRAVKQYRKSGLAPHIVAMREVKDAVEDLSGAVRSVEVNANELIANYLAANIEIGAKIVTGEAQLEVTREALRLQEQELELRQKAFDETQRVLDNAARELRDSNLIIADAEATYRTQMEAIRAAENIHREASRGLDNLNRELANLKRDIGNVPHYVTEKVCRVITTPRVWPLTDVIERLCETVQSVNSAWSRLNNAITDTERNIVREANRQQSALAAKAAAEGRALAAQQRKLQEQSRLAALQAAQDAAKVAHDVTVTPLKIQEELVRSTREQVQKLEAEVEDFRKQFADRETWVRTLRDALNDIRLLDGIMGNWRKGIDRAGEAYIETGLTSSRMILANEHGILKQYMKWLACHGDVFLATPYQLADAGCNLKTLYEETTQKIDDLKRQLLPPGVREIYDLAEQLQKVATDELQKAVKNASFELVRHVTGDSSLVELLKLLDNPAYATRGKLNELLGNVGDANGKALLTFTAGADIVDADAGMTAGRWNPDAFNAVRYARTMSRLSLLPGKELNRMSGKLNGNWLFRWKLHPENGRRYTIMARTVRSIDGNQQWQPYGLPYGRTAGGATPLDPRLRHYGYGPLDGDGAGLRIFQDPDARKTVFGALFPRPLSSVEADPRLQLPFYPFPSCARNPFPVTFRDDGSPLESDGACSGAAPLLPPPAPARSIWTLWRR